MLIVAAIVLAALVGAPVFAVIGAASLAGFHHDQTPWPVTAANIYQLASQRALITIPLFTFAGYLMAEAKTAARIVRLSRALLGWMPGGLAVVTVATCAFFTTFTGASGVTIIAIGGLLYPVLTAECYPARFNLGLITASGSIGLLFPPSLPLILYGIIYGLSQPPDALMEGTFNIERFLVAGIAPGIFLVAVVGAFAVAVGVRCCVPRTSPSAREVLAALWEAKWEAPIPFVLLALILRGVITVGEAAAVTALYVLIVECFVYRDLGLGRDLPRVARDSMVLVGAIYVIICTAMCLTGYFIDADVPGTLLGWLDRYVHSRWSFLLALNVFLLVVGCLMDIFSAIVVVVPLIVPLAVRYGVDPYHLGIIFLVNLEIGYLTPPVGMNLFIASFRFNKSVTAAYAAALPFLGLMLVALLAVTYLPWLTLGPLALAAKVLLAQP